MTTPAEAAHVVHQLAAIVSDLGSGEPPIAIYDYTQDGLCLLCEASVSAEHTELDHYENCPWRRAKRLMGG